MRLLLLARPADQFTLIFPSAEVVNPISADADETVNRSSSEATAASMTSSDVDHLPLFKALGLGHRRRCKHHQETGCVRPGRPRPDLHDLQAEFAPALGAKEPSLCSGLDLGYLQAPSTQ